MTSEFNVAIHSLVFLNHKQESISSEALAENVCTNPARVRRVLAKLKKDGLIETKEGIDGGYRFILPPEQVDLARIARCLEVQFVGANWRSGDQDMACMVASGMADIMDQIYRELNHLCYQRLEKITIADIDHKIFQKG